MENKISFELVLKEAVKLPFVRIDRESFLKATLSKHFDSDTVMKAIAFTPAFAGIPKEEMRKIADACIDNETTKVTMLSAAAGMPGGLAMFGTIPADLLQYMGHVLIITQKLVYLYGWQDLFNENDQMDDATANLLTLFVGVMFGVNGAAGAINKISEVAVQKIAEAVGQKAANAAAQKAANFAAQKAANFAAQKVVVKGAATSVIKKIAEKLGIKLSKDVLLKGAAKAIPILGALTSGAITYATYKPMAKRLQSHLAELHLADPNFIKEN